ncbi:hypothetical protein [Helicobacter enhydrae]|uniref:hypothetical protein n=1 Tax=Helicobacter enhydrae TaxID=222136 RepID=UPI00190017C4|nr:hypothetical protein [Helicobacter enhydrae]
MFGTNFVLSNQDALLVPKSSDFVQKLSGELFEKTGFALYVVVANLEGGATASQKRKQFKEEFLHKLQTPYGVVFMIPSHQKIDIVLSPHFADIDTRRIIYQFMVKILMQQKDLTPQIISASLLNGYAQLADEIARHYGVQLEGNAIVDSSGVSDYVHYSLYVMLGLPIMLILYIYCTRRRDE